MIVDFPSKETHTSIFQAKPLWEAASQLGYPTAVWRLPRHDKYHILVSLQSGAQHRKPDLETLPPSFVLHPFETSPEDEVLVLEGDLIFTFSDTWALQAVQSTLGEEHPKVKRFLEKAEDLANAPEQDLLWAGLSPSTEPDPEKKSHFTSLVNQALEAIREKEFTKIVLSRTKHYTYPDHFQSFEAFKRLSFTYPSAFVFLVNLPDSREQWLGATPETLVSMDQFAVFRTTSLAGTQSAWNEHNEWMPEREVRWGQKEIEEQALVSRYIVECFKKIRLREYHERGPKTVLAGNLYHLRTDFEVDTREVNFPELGTVMLSLLHPTSAVCGMPKGPALRFINDREGYDRSFYSGYLGPVNIQGESALFVNLRSLRLLNGRATLYAGAGITEDSDPEKEWAETEMKCDTLLRVLI